MIPLNTAIVAPIDVAAATLTLPDETIVEFALDGFAQQCLIEGIDQLGFLQRLASRIESYEENRSWKP